MMSRPKMLFLFFLIVLLLYLLIPFANGLGCNFTFQENGEHVKQIGKCKSGILTSYYQSLDDTKSSYNRYVYGVFGEHFYLIRINKERVKPSLTPNPATNLVIDDEHAFSLYDGDRLYISRYHCANRNRECLIATDDPIENIYRMTFYGRLGFF